jgi:hypothetical protein|tara:strand:+ start:128 stop:451 length:324 start_codon:yes stop_codon:yes gene_type:complete
MANTYTNHKVDLTTTDLTTLYTIPDATTAIIKSIIVSDDSGSGSTITVNITDSGANVFSIVSAKTISAATLTELLSQPLIAKQNEIIKVQAGNANRLHVILSVLEIT